MGERGRNTPYVNIFVFGKKYKVPYDLTIMEAMEYAGFRFTRGSGCRQGLCGACATLYRMRDNYNLKSTLACQELVKDGMYILMVPYSPAKKATYNIKEVKPSANVILEYYPEVAKCLACNTCTKVCPQSLEVMDFVQASLRGDFKEVSELSFECIDCGLCAIRCPAEIVPYLVARFARRIYGRHIVGIAEDVEKRRKEIEKGIFDEELEEISKLNLSKLREMYSKRDFL